MQFEIKNYDQTLQFEGDLLGHSTTFEDGRQRWHEVSIYKTTLGEYVVHKVGRSEVPKEIDRNTAFVSETADGAIDCLYTRNRGGVKFLTYAAEEAIDAAGKLDPLLRKAYLTRNLTPRSTAS
jgi:hypothetical protein